MCGICGFITRKKVNMDVLQRANNSMAHRGPDDSGVELYSLTNGYTLGLAQRRLSILDLSNLGHQPMHSADHRISVVYNGEIYNFQELKNELSDYSFISNCDTEVIIAAYCRWGIQCVERFNGMFAIAIFDRKDDSLYLIRDRMGVKPLFYSFTEENIYFGSELKALMYMPGVDTIINKRVLGRYLFEQYIASPDTIFEQVNKVKPGEILHFRQGSLKKSVFWNPAQRYFDLCETTGNRVEYDQAKVEFQSLLVDSVKLRMIADVSVGTFLSGGYDSSLITAIASKCSNKKLQTFTIGFEEESYNEARYAKQIANYLGTQHTELYMSEENMLEMLKDITTYYDEPFADSSQIATMLVAQLAKKDVTVVLSGDGGDELFCGYNHYDTMRIAQKYDRIGQTLHRMLPLDVVSKMPVKVQKLIYNCDKRYKTQFDVYSYSRVIRDLFIASNEEIRYDESDLERERDYQKRRMLLDQMTYLPDDIMCKVDRATMKYSLEARSPLLDYRIVEYSYALPHQYKYFNGVKKRILKDVAYEYVPQELLDRPKKGFSVPIEKWLRGVLKEELLELSGESYLKRQGLFRADTLSDIIREYLRGEHFPVYDFSRLIWAFYVFQKWYSEYC